ncbi:flagellar hook-associated protein FlgK [Anaeroselena agilis]|uniref:Flagellar hook-associated protein 1 n=1 Tax=Anaeroselena agilis TaxID=3063788 RepID=A0ABU3NZ84_9FIRM|nr:flagellar hook-associated protein FlgK [Selenomonadales bacterium 4137-cl]
MASTFGTYNVSYSGMYVSQAGLTATTNNLANVGTTGASRVRVSVTDTSTTLADGTTTTSGASVASITRARDRLLDATYRTQNADAGYWAVKSGDLEYMQELLNEYAADDGTSSDGLQQLINEFFSGWDALATDTTSTSARQQVVDSANSLIAGLTEIYGQLEQLRADAVSGTVDGVDSLNRLAEQVAELNRQIADAEVTGGEASYLRDQRDVLVDQMSALANITVYECSSGYQVTINGAALVSGYTANKLAASGSGTADDPLTITWENSGKGVSITGGSIAAYMEDADQTGYAAIDTGSLPYAFTTDAAASSVTTMMQALDDLLTTVAAKINALQSAGGGVAFFTAADTSQPLSIANIQVNASVAGDTILIVTGAEDGDNAIAAAIYDLCDEDIFSIAGLAMDVSEFYEAVISWVGTAGDNAAGSYETQSALVSQVDSQRQSIFSISLDEEMSNLIIYQEAYTANARVLSTIDGLIGDLIEDLG